MDATPPRRLEVGAPLLILSTAYVVPRHHPVYFEIIAATDHDRHAPRVIIATFDRELYARALEVEGTDTRIALTRAEGDVWRRM